METIVVTTVAVVIAAEIFILNRAQKWAQYEDAVAARLARYAGRRLQ